MLREKGIKHREGVVERKGEGKRGGWREK